MPEPTEPRPEPEVEKFSPREALNYVLSRSSDEQVFILWEMVADEARRRREAQRGGQTMTDPEFCPAEFTKAGEPNTDHSHCECWWDCLPCCRCGDDTPSPDCDCERCTERTGRA